MGNMWLWYWELVGVENSPYSLDCFLKRLFNHLALQVGVQAFKMLMRSVQWKDSLMKSLWVWMMAWKRGQSHLICQLWVSTSNWYSAV